jgi:hypothetical protein
MACAGFAGWWIGSIRNTETPRTLPEKPGERHNKSGLVADLQADWSESENPHKGPFGTWSFNLESKPLSHIASWSSLAAVSGWGPSTNIRGNDAPFAFRAPPNLTSPQDIGPEYNPRDIVMLSTDRFNSRGTGEANITWTSPQTATASIALALWPTRHINRQNNWQLSMHSGNSSRVLGEGTLPEDGTCTRARPSTFTLPSIDLNAADVLELRLSRSPAARDPAGDFAGIMFTISSPPNLSPSLAGQPASAISHATAQSAIAHDRTPMIIASLALVLSVCACAAVAVYAVLLRRSK